MNRAVTRGEPDEWCLAAAALIQAVVLMWLGHRLANAAHAFDRVTATTRYDIAHLMSGLRQQQMFFCVFRLVVQVMLVLLVVAVVVLLMAMVGRQAWERESGLLGSGLTRRASSRRSAAPTQALADRMHPPRRGQRPAGSAFLQPQPRLDALADLRQPRHRALPQQPLAVRRGDGEDQLEVLAVPQGVFQRPLPRSLLNSIASGWTGTASAKTTAPQRLSSKMWPRSAASPSLTSIMACSSAAACRASASFTRGVGDRCRPRMLPPHGPVTNTQSPGRAPLRVTGPRPVASPSRVTETTSPPAQVFVSPPTIETSNASATSRRPW